MRWWGLYTQRKPGIDGGKTATLEPHELDDEYFMLRVRCDGGALSLQQLRTIADISVEFGRGTADVTDRQNIQLHWIRVEDVPEIWRRLEAVGLSTQEACGDCPRVVLGSPVAGVAADEIIDGTPAVRAIVDNYIGDPRFSNLPRKFKTAISGSPHHDVAHEINDVAFVGVVHPELGPGFDVWVGGGLSTNPKLGVRLGAFVTLEQIPEVWVGVVEHLPRLRLPPAAHPCAPEVPGRRLGPRAVPARCWRASTSARAAGRPRAAPAAHRSPRPRRRAPAERRQLLRRRRPDGRSHLGRAPAAAGRPRRGRRRPTGSG